MQGYQLENKKKEYSNLRNAVIIVPDISHSEIINTEKNPPQGSYQP